MGRKNKNAIIANKGKKPDTAAASKLNKVKKDKNAFKVASTNKLKKAKQVQNQVQNVSNRACIIKVGDKVKCGYPFDFSII